MLVIFPALNFNQCRDDAIACESKVHLILQGQLNEIDFAAEAVKSSSWPLGFTGPWDTKGNHVMEFDAWVYYVSQQKIGRLRKRFRTFILFEEKRFPQLALLAIKASNNEDFWSAVNILLKSFFTGDPMSIDSWTKLEFKMSNPNLLLFTDSPEHKDKELSKQLIKTKKIKYKDNVIQLKDFSRGAVNDNG